MLTAEWPAQLQQKAEPGTIVKVAELARSTKQAAEGALKHSLLAVRDVRHHHPLSTDFRILLGDGRDAIWVLVTEEVASGLRPNDIVRLDDVVLLADLADRWYVLNRCARVPAAQAALQDFKSPRRDRHRWHAEASHGP